MAEPNPSRLAAHPEREGFLVTLLLAACLLLGTFVLVPFPDAVDPGQPIMLTYLRRVRPGMTVAQVRRVFPAEMFCRDQVTDRAVPMTRRFRPDAVSRELHLADPNTEGLALCHVYFGADGRIVGFSYSVSSAGRLGRDELWFPGTICETGGSQQR